jgi:hypothetical protein
MAPEPENCDIANLGAKIAAVESGDRCLKGD